MPADTAYNESGVVIPSLFGSPGAAFQGAINIQQREKERQQELDIQKQRQQESDEWRKLNLIQDLTDLSKHQTGSDVANAIGNQKAASTLQKYTGLAKTMSPSELQAKISQEMNATIGSMTALKDELNLSEEGIKQIKAAHPDLDIARLAKDMRTDVLQRRLTPNNELRNPLEVPQSQMRFTEPDVLANYVQGTKNLDEQIINPKGLESMEILSGNPNYYTKYKGKVPFWMKENFDRTKFKNGFYTGREEPQLQIKSSILPAKALPASGGRPFEVIDEDVYQKFSENANTDLELTAAAMKKFPTFGKFTAEEKELAKRNVLFEKIKTLDKSGYYPTEVKTPSASLLKFYAGGSGSASDTNVNDIYSKISSEVTRLQDYGEKKVPMNIMDLDAQKVILDMVNAGKTADEKISSEDIYLDKSEKGEILIKEKGGNLIGSLPKVGTNLKVQPAVKEKRAVIQQGENKTTTKKDPLGLF